MTDDEIASALDGICLILVGFYVLKVWQASNTDKLLDELSTETGFLEFVVSAALLVWAANHDKTEIAYPLMSLGLVGALLSVMGRFDISGALSDFASGKAGLFATIARIFGQNQTEN